MSDRKDLYVPLLFMILLFTNHDSICISNVQGGKLPLHYCALGSRNVDVVRLVLEHYPEGVNERDEVVYEYTLEKEYICRMYNVYEHGDW